MTFKPQHDPSHLYFVTATTLRWHPLFTQRTYALLVLNSLDWHRRKKRFELFAYVVMPTHVHLLVKPTEGLSISAVLQSFGSFTAHAILDQLKTDHDLEALALFTHRQDHDPNKQHQIWQPIQAKNVYSEAFLREKLEYLHNNPIAKRWHLSDNRADYIYSSACFYDHGLTPVVEVDDIRPWLA